ncbi:MAG: ATP-binding protein [Planctomycetota bacterium]
MSRKWPIRTKLRISITLLSVILMLLSLSGLWGLYAFKQLAKEVSRQAGEIPLIGQLSRLAMDMHESDVRSQELWNQRGMIDSFGVSFSFATNEQKSFEGSAALFGMYLERLRTAVNDPDGDSVLVDNGLRRQRVKQIAETYARVQEAPMTLEAISVDARTRRRLALESLVEQTGNLAILQYEGMRDFKDDVRGRYTTLIGVAWSASLLAAALIVVLVIAFRWHVVKPFVTLLHGSRLVGQNPPGTKSIRIELETGDELSELAEAMNGMTSRFEAICGDLDAQVKQRSREVIRNEQLASVGFLAAGVAHEINNPLAAIAWSAESLKNQLSGMNFGETNKARDKQVFEPEFDQELSEGLTRIEDEAYRCKDIIEKLLDFSRLGEVRRTQQDLAELVRDVIDMVGKVGKYRCTTIRMSGEGSLRAHVNPQEIRQVILNLLTNALESVDANGSIDVNLSAQHGHAVIRIEDNGCGMTQEVLDQLFEPFFTRRRDGTGTGLGLSITYRIVTQHGGSLEAQSDGCGHGSTMLLSLPLAAAETDEPANFAPRAHRLGPTNTPTLHTETPTLHTNPPTLHNNPKQAA